MSQLAPQHLGQLLGRASHVPNMDYAYDVAHRDGHFSATVEIVDFTSIPPIKMSNGVVCPMPWGACVSSVTGGVIVGHDMYEQLVKETVAAAGTSKIAFAAILSAPADAKWTNKYGLPYKFVAVNADTPPDITITPPAADGDARGTFIYTGAFTSRHQATVTVAYKAATGNLMGDPYAARFKSGELGSVALAVTAVYVPATGVVTVTVPASTPAGIKTTVTFPDGTTKRGVAGTPLVHTLSPLWRSKYADTIRGPAANRLIAVGFDGNVIEGVYAIVTGFPASTAADPEPEPDPDPVPLPPVFPTLPASFSTHAQADEWLDAYTLALGVGEPLDWASQTLLQKHASAQALIDALDGPT